MRRYIIVVASALIGLVNGLHGQTPVPNGDFENWTSFGSYENPTGWDTPNQAIQVGLPFGTKVVTKSSDHESGNFSARLESKQLTFPSVVVPGIVTLGTLSIDIFTQTISVTGGAPINDMPTHLKGYFKFQPAGGDSCLIGIGLSKWNNGVRDSVGIGSFSTHDAVNAWTPFSAWIDYKLTETPDTFNIVAISSADSNSFPGSVLYIDNLYLDYTLGVNPEDPAAGIDTYQDRELHQILVWYDFEKPETAECLLYNMTGQAVVKTEVRTVLRDRSVLNYDHLSAGVYLLEILHGGKKFSKKFILNN